MKYLVSARLLGLMILLLVPAMLSSQPWIADLGNGKYKNPVLFAVHPNIAEDGGYADFDWFRVE